MFNRARTQALNPLLPTRFKPRTNPSYLNWNVGVVGRNRAVWRAGIASQFADGVVVDDAHVIYH
jgi:hypothetical protein